MDFSKLKRGELQKLAKKNGIKANQKNEKLVKALTSLENVDAEETFLATFMSDDDSSGSGILSSDQEVNSSVETLRQGSPPPQKNIKKTSLSEDFVKNISTSSADTSLGYSDCILLSSTTPIWDDFDSEPYSDSIVNAAPFGTRETKDVNENIKLLSKRSSSRNQVIRSSTKKQSTAVSTPQDKKIDFQVQKTFSIPKKRSNARIANKENSAKKSASKRKCIEHVYNTNKEKKPRKSKDDCPTNMENVLSAVEQKLGRPSQLRGKHLDCSTTSAADGIAFSKSNAKSPGKQLFKGAHSKGFDKLESIDDYQKRKEERAEMLLGSGRSRQVLSRLSKPKTPTAKASVRPKPSIPTPGFKKTMPVLLSRKSALKQHSVFKPSVMSTSRIDTNFAARSSKLITPKKIAVSFAKSPSKTLKTATGTPRAQCKTPTGLRKRPSRASLTPFKPSTALNTPVSAKKNTFNLEESLKKPLSWVPHKGPLKTYEDNAKPLLQRRIKNAKNPPKVTTRENRRKDRQVARKNTKTDQMMRRRGIK